MTISHSLDRIVVVPRNGYVNRLQAWASAAILGAELDVPVQVLWESEPIAPARASDLFSNDRVRVSFIDTAAVTELLGQPHEAMPRYLTIQPSRQLVILAGHDLGEQSLMDPLVSALNDSCRPTALVIIAGGKYHLPNSGDFVRQRQVFYERLEWHPTIAERVSKAMKDRPPFIGVHVRQTDRSREAPTTQAIRAAVTELAGRTGLQSLFIAADSPSAREQLAREVRALGLDPWWTGGIDFDRASAQAGQDAMVDWVLLGRARAIAYSATSSFGEEAAVAAGSSVASIALSASRSRQRLRDAARLGRAAVTYPNRHWRT